VFILNAIVMRDSRQFTRKPRAQRNIVGIDVGMGEDVGVHDDLLDERYFPSVACKAANGAGILGAAGYG
jgi:hypothetical protein